jgi:glycosyltransferase involved in cell wall biosynthesis
MQTELVVLSHLRWDWVWQRPQQLISRMSANQKTWFVEEPLSPPGRTSGPNRLNTLDVDGVRRVWLEIPEQGRHVGYFDQVLPDYIEQLPRLIGPATGERVVWLYTPLALEVALALEPTTLVYDVMDDLAAFKDPAPELLVRQRQALRRADVVFAGGRSLHSSLVRQGRTDARLFPSGVTPEHYAAALTRPAKPSPRPVAGYIGVIDERLDLDLLRQLAGQLPDWEIRMIGPVAKISPGDLPQAPNITYAGHKSYAELPAAMAGLDVALMPFALNEATRSISPTKTLEYLAGGLPVISTPVPDVASEFADVVHLRRTARDFAALCRDLGPRKTSSRPDPGVRELLRRYHWDSIAAQMQEAVSSAGSRALSAVRAEATA